MGQAILELVRLVKSGGSIIIFETLGTGVYTPTPPTKGLADYYEVLERKWEFSRMEIQTDYQFKNPEEAVDMISFFFGEELADKVNKKQSIRVPEWTGVWRKIK